MTNEVTRHDLKVCPDCFGRGEIYVTGPSGNNPLVSICATCKGNRYIPAPAPEDKPKGAAILDEPLTASDHRFAALIAENEALLVIRAQLRLSLTEAKTELAAARAEIVRLRDGIEAIANRADDIYTDASLDDDIHALGFATLRDAARALLNRKGED